MASVQAQAPQIVEAAFQQHAADQAASLQQDQPEIQDETPAEPENSMRDVVNEHLRESGPIAREMMEGEDAVQAVCDMEAALAAGGEPVVEEVAEAADAQAAETPEAASAVEEVAQPVDAQVDVSDPAPSAETENNKRVVVDEYIRESGSIGWRG